MPSVSYTLLETSRLSRDPTEVGLKHHEALSMRSFGGDLGILGLGNLLQVISMSQARGFLSISQAELKKTIQFCSNGIRLVSGVRRAIPLGQILLRCGRITSHQLDQLLAEQRTTARRLGDLVIEKKLVTKEFVDQALRDQVAEEIYELFGYPEARFYFAETENEALPAGAGPLATVLLDSNVISLMVEAARRSDEMARIRSEIPVDQLVPRRLETAQPLEELGLAREAAEVMSLVDGTRSVEQIFQESSCTRFTVLHTLYDLKQKGYLGMGAESVSGASKSGHSGPSVLLICKESSDRGQTATQLRGGGYHIVEADSWAGAESWLDATAAIVLDMSSDVEEGLSICERIREDTRKPFIVLTENTAGQALDSALQSGARYVLLKPIPEKLLLDRLAHLL